MEVSDLLSLKSTSVFKGEMTISKLSIEPGAVFIGSCNMADKRNATVESTKK
jgi:cytoskeletal protein CcmA (bactofilin family)